MTTREMGLFGEAETAKESILHIVYIGLPRLVLYYRGKQERACAVVVEVSIRHLSRFSLEIRRYSIGLAPPDGVGRHTRPHREKVTDGNARKEIVGEIGRIFGEQVYEPIVERHNAVVNRRTDSNSNEAL